jgi:hypothetical protein
MHVCIYMYTDVYVCMYLYLNTFIFTYVYTYASMFLVMRYLFISVICITVRLLLGWSVRMNHTLEIVYCNPLKLSSSLLST